MTYPTKVGWYFAQTEYDDIVCVRVIIHEGLFLACWPGAYGMLDSAYVDYPHIRWLGTVPIPPIVTAKS